MAYLFKHPLGVDVLTAARRRTKWVFDTFPRVYLSFSAGKDSTVMLHLAAEEARARGRRFGLLLVDLEAQYKLTIEHAEKCFSQYSDCAEPYWLALPLNLRNAVSQYEPQWTCWEPGREADWVRRPPAVAVTDGATFPWFRQGMEFEELVVEFGAWYSAGQLTACLVGIRTDESLNRFRTLFADKSRFGDVDWTTWKGGALYSAYPIYDWRTEDIWTFHARYPGLAHNRLYDLMQAAGLGIHQQRICQPYGDDQRKGLWLFHLIEPETWGRVVARVAGANGGALYCREAGNAQGVGKITKPEGHSWQSFARLLLASMPANTREHFENKISVFLKWHLERGYSQGIPDHAAPAEEAKRATPSWRRVCKALLRNDYWCKGLSFSQHKSTAYEKYLKVMRNRRKRWNLSW